MQAPPATRRPQVMAGYLFVVLLTLIPRSGFAASNHPWLPNPNTDTVLTRFAPPEGYTRLGVAEDSIGSWLRTLPLLPGNPAVKLFDGALKRNQSAQAAVVDIDVGTRDLQQCADAVMRLRAEYLRAANKEQKICFRFSDGTDAVWSDWKAGYRAQPRGKRIAFEQRASVDGSYTSFRKYLNLVFSYAGSMSLQNELQRVADPSALLPGDVFVRGGFPGHAVIVLDVAERPDGDRVFLLAQSYMPAQQIHVLKNPKGEGAWYHTSKAHPLETPEWVFPPGSLSRFPDRNCRAVGRAR